MDLAKVIKDRRTIRRYKPAKVPKRLLRKVLDSARWAPSLHNMQPWRFIIADGAAKKKVIDILNSSKDKEPFLIRITLRESIKVIESAPLIILAYNNGALSNQAKKGGKAYTNYYNNARILEIQSVSCAIQNILLTAHSLGLGVAWLGVSMFGKKEIDRFFGTNYMLMAVLAIGYPREDKPVRPPARKPLSEIISFKK